MDTGTYDGNEVVLFNADDIFFCQGDPAQYMYIIRSGSVAVEVAKPEDLNDPKKYKRVALIGPGEPVGEMALVLPDGKRTATVKALTSGMAERISREEFNALLSTAHPMIQDIVRAFRRRLADTTQQAVAKS